MPTPRPFPKFVGLRIFDQQTNLGFREAVADQCLDAAALLRRRVKCATAHLETLSPAKADAPPATGLAAIARLVQREMPVRPRGLNGCREGRHAGPSKRLGVTAGRRGASMLGHVPRVAFDVA
jgi:hypothetical protein